ncbi:MAG TPA: phosphonate ABC transporter [Hydrogenophaga sp.]|uniref:phosphonate ABC transporter ATP-binding protein n=1 Tax=Hydrogenophaga sp. TaxID=1904254 RepID=UPI0008C874FD|nr:ATP-binding cassette domain-containing protein [Hydrogenophaga sp.]MBU4180423.1 ATP-binding cassette domain-containing protein [Gammaproteobacteria bacterium]OGA74040.1 MAG: phosphonate ABC transporter [Burkholderiales bacterium GWE1_65_30]OGA89993.1 MAG: phosphonate ABC transporter [Burkholderiales bacterium GWF1_66_17]OGB31015.1 MAG: phosphonate ABC transporter [Burkholderiales bacterium RIFCSPLOWO2_02_FULL_66_35]PKO77045.1 MAG: phosphonate ABC transporter [Betaproteobacteria bacterium HG
MNIDLQGVSARHPAARPGAAPALKGLTLRVAHGEQVAVIGPSGAGKTTLLQVVACAMQPQAGTLQLDGQSPWQLPRGDLQRLRGRLFLAPQVPPLPPRQRVVTAVLAGRLPAMGLWQSLRSLFYPVDIPAAFEALDRFDLADKLFERVDRLSGGERQRVGLARALLAPASLWLIDEPLSALDPARSRQAIDTLLAGAREHGATLVTTLHQVEVALEHFPRIVGLRDGALAFDLPAAQVTREHLARLYDQHEDELHGPAPLDAAPPPTPQPVVMHCR